MEPAKEDISVAIAKLNYGIDDVSKQIKNVVRRPVCRCNSRLKNLKVTAHHEDLLEQAAGVGELSGSLQTVREGLDALDSSLEKCAFITRHCRRDCTDFTLVDCAKNFVRPTRPCKRM